MMSHKLENCVCSNFKSKKVVNYLQLEEEAMTLDGTEGIVWKNLRKNMSPTFTSGKLKGMMEPMTQVIDRFMGHLEKIAGKGTETDVKPIFQGMFGNKR